MQVSDLDEALFAHGALLFAASAEIARVDFPPPAVSRRLSSQF
jgi:hypothetical protein